MLQNDYYVTLKKGRYYKNENNRKTWGISKSNVGSLGCSKIGCGSMKPKRGLVF